MPTPPPAKRLSGVLPSAPPVHVAVCSWAGYGPEYLNLERGDVLLPMQIPDGVDPEGWAYGELRREMVLV